MQDGSSISTIKLIAWMLWAVVATLILAAWVTWFLDAVDGLPMMLSTTACAISAAAAVAHLRCYSRQVCTLIRVTAKLGGDAVPTKGAIRSIAD